MCYILCTGTTVLRAFDTLPAIADIYTKYKLWFRVDTAWGGGILTHALSQAYWTWQVMRIELNTVQ
jgi:glutamate/tyrosine decarboxylase-like PLP-dependent enzyme